MFEQTFKNIDDILFKDSGADSELDYIESSPKNPTNPRYTGSKAQKSFCLQSNNLPYVVA